MKYRCTRLRKKKGKLQLLNASILGTGLVSLDDNSFVPSVLCSQKWSGQGGRGLQVRTTTTETAFVINRARFLLTQTVRFRASTGTG